MSKFYTNVLNIGNNILYRGVVNGRRVKMKVAYTPTLFLHSNKKSEYKSLLGHDLESVKFDSIREAKEFVNNYSEVDNFKIYGNTRFEYAFIAEHYGDDIDWDIDKLNIGVIDIEVGSENGFPDPYNAIEPITAITIKGLKTKGLVS